MVELIFLSRDLSKLLISQDHGCKYIGGIGLKSPVTTEREVEIMDRRKGRKGGRKGKR